MRARLKHLLVAGALLLLGRRRRRKAVPRDRERVVPKAPPEPTSELAAICLFAAAALCGVGFVVVYALDRLPRQTQLLGVALGLAFCFLAGALILTGKRLVVSERLEHDYPREEHPDEQASVVQIVEESGERLTRRRLFKLAVAGAGGAVGVALLTPAASLGPILDIDPLYGTPWRRGRRLVDEDGKPWRAADIERDGLYTAFPEGADKEELGSPVVLVRLAAEAFHLPPELARYPAQGIVAYSKICTHAGCAVSLYRAPLFSSDEPGPALVCPCHYSTFDPTKGGTVEFGPAGRKLPMLPLLIDSTGYLRAAGNFSGPVGPSWWGVRMRRARP